VKVFMHEQDGIVYAMKPRVIVAILFFLLSVVFVIIGQFIWNGKEAYFLYVGRISVLSLGFWALMILMNRGGFYDFESGKAERIKAEE